MNDHDNNTMLDLDGLVMSRSELDLILPDLERFECSLSDAVQVNRDMRASDGVPPAYTDEWSEQRRYHCVLTMQEIGLLKMQAEARQPAGSTQ